MSNINKFSVIFFLSCCIILYWIIVSLPNTSQSNFSHLTITHIKHEGDLGLDFDGHYEVSNYRKKPRKRKGDYYELKTQQSLDQRCQQSIILPNLPDEQVSNKEIFFLETSGRGKLSARQACSVESASKFSNCSITVILLSDVLDLSDNPTCQLYLSSNSVRFYTADLSEVYSNTPLLETIQSKKFAYSKFRATHQSDAFRLALIYKYGGFYIDLDTVTIRSLSQYKNIIGATKINAKSETPAHLANGVFHFSAGHPLLWKTMEEFAKVYTGNTRVEVGPMLITKVVKAFFNVSSISGLDNEMLTVLPSSIFYPIRAFEVQSLWPTKPKSFEAWEKMFSDSKMVHMYASQSNQWLVEKDPSHEAYALLGPRYCPSVYSSSSEF